MLKDLVAPRFLFAGSALCALLGGAWVLGGKSVRGLTPSIRPGIYSVAVDGSSGRYLDVKARALSRGPRGGIALIQGSRLAVMQVDGTHLRMLGDANVGSGVAIPPAWSPSGTRIAVGVGSRCDAFAPCQRWSIWIVRVRDGRRSLLVRGGDAPTWSPNGREIAYEGAFDTSVRRPQGPMAIFTISSRGGKAHRIARGVLPSWSPDGSMVAYLARNRAGDFGGLNVVRASGAHNRLFASANAAFSWSPDGSKIAYVGPHPIADRVEVRWVRSNGRRRLGAGFGSAIGSVAWSPDGARIAWVYPDAAHGRSLLLIASVRHPKPRVLARTKLTDHITTPVFSRDGRHVLYTVVR